MVSKADVSGKHKFTEITVILANGESLLVKIFEEIDFPFITVCVKLMHKPGSHMTDKSASLGN